jgi:hypothetical protein
VPTELAGWTFTIENGAKVVVASGGTLDLSALTVAGAVKLDGTIEVSGTLKVPAPTPAVIAWGTNGNFKLNYGSIAEMGGMKYIGANGVADYLYNWTDTTSGGMPPPALADQYVSLKDKDMTLHGNLTSTNHNAISDKVTIEAGSTLSIAADKYLVINAGADVQVFGTLELAGNAAWLLMKSSTGKVVLNPNGKLDVKDAGARIINDVVGGNPVLESYVKVTVSATANGTPATKATLTTKTTNQHTLTTNATAWSTTGAGDSTNSISLVLGTLKIASTTTPPVPDTNVITGATDSAGAIASLTAGTGTYITFARTEPVAATAPTSLPVGESEEPASEEPE